MTSMPAFTPFAERFLLFLSVRQEHSPISPQLNGDRFWQWKPNPAAVGNTCLHLCSGPCPPAGTGDWTEVFLRLCWASRAAHLFPHPHPSSGLPEFIPSTVLSSDIPQEKIYICMQRQRICMHRNPSALRRPIPVCFPHAKSSIPLGFFFLVCGLCIGSSPALWVHCVLNKW